MPQFLEIEQSVETLMSKGYFEAVIWPLLSMQLEHKQSEKYWNIGLFE